MRFHTALIFIVLMFTSHSHAETVDVTSGEHTDFTRIFLFTAPATPWVTAKNSNIIRVTNPKFVGSFDLSNVFDKINSERISSVRNITGGLEFKLNCDCILAVEPFGKVGTILDFRNADVSIISSDQEISVQNLGSSLWAPQTTDGREALSNRFKEEASPERRKANGNLGTDQVSRQSADSLDEIASIVSNSLNDLRQTISLPGRTKKTNVDSANINTRQDCEFSELFDARKWADERPIYEQINAAHSQDLTSSGALTTPDNRTLVKLYLAFSMFPEARQALRTPQNEEEQALSKLITILETVPSNTQPRIFIEGPCLSDAQIFNILGDPKSVYLSKERIVHIYKTLGGWPTELRKRTIDVLSKRVRNMEGNSNQEFNVGRPLGSKKQGSIVDIVASEIRLKGTDANLEHHIDAWLLTHQSLTQRDIAYLQAIKFEQSDTRILQKLDEIKSIDLIFRGRYREALILQKEISQEALRIFIKKIEQSNIHSKNTVQNNLFLKAVKSTNFKVNPRLKGTSLESANNSHFKKKGADIGPTHRGVRKRETPPLTLEGQAIDSSTGASEILSSALKAANDSSRYRKNLAKTLK